MRVRYRFDRFELEPAEARLERDGVAVELQPKVLDALLLFVEKAGQLISKDELLGKLWPDTIVTEESLTQVVRKLRLALGDDPAAPRFLETVPRRGYRWIAPVETLEASAAAEPARAAVEVARLSVPAPSETTKRPAGKRLNVRRWQIAVATAICALVAWALANRRAATPNPLLAGGEPRRITSSAAREGTPAISRDGRFAAVSVNTGAGGALELQLVPLDGGRPIPLTETVEDEWQPRFSPDGRELLFLRGISGTDGAALWAMGIFGGGERRIAELATAADWSPDGRRVALARPEGDGTALELLELATGERRPLAESDQGISSLGWSPDGLRLAYLDGNSIATVEVDGGAPRRLLTPARHVRTVVWESAESLLTDASWSEGASRVSRIRIGGGEAEPLLVGPPGVHELARSASGRLLYVAEYKSRQVWRLSPGGGAAVALDLPTTVEGFDVDAAAAKLAFTDWDPAPGFGTLGLLELARGGRRELGDGLCPALARDGSRLAALGDRPGATGLAIVDLATGARSTVAVDRRPPGRTDGALFRCPDFSPDGRSVAYLAIGESGEDGLWVVDLESSSARLLAAGSFGAPSWSPDGRRVAVCDFGRSPGTVRIVAADGGEALETGLVCPFRARPLWESNDELWLLEDQKLAPRLLLRTLDGRRLRDVALEIPRDLGFWGVFEVRRAANGTWFALAERYESDLYLLEAAAE